MIEFRSNEQRRKLSDAVVGEIRRRYVAGETMKTLAADHGVSVTTVARAVWGKTYRWVETIAADTLAERYRLSRGRNGERGAEVTNRRGRR